MPIEVGTPEPKPDLATSAVKGPDGSTRLLRGSSQETRSGLTQAFQKGKAPECSGETHVVSDSKSLPAKPTQVDNKLEYGTASHVSHTVRNVDEAKKSFLTRNWKTCKNDKEVSTWIEGLTLSKANRTKLATWTAHVQKWHSDLTATEQAGLDQTIANWGVPIRDVAKLKAGSLLRILAVGTILVA